MVTLAMPPMRTGGTAMMMQPKAAIYEVSSALAADLLESTLWKYTWRREGRTCVYTRWPHLPGDATEGEQQEVVTVVGVPPPSTYFTNLIHSSFRQPTPILNCWVQVSIFYCSPALTSSV